MTRSRPEQGQATVELALVLPVVVLALLLVIQVAVVVRADLAVAEAAREGARAAAIGESDATVGRVVAATPGLVRSRVHTTVRHSGTTVQVTVTYAAPTDVALVGGLVGDATVSATVTMRREDDP